METISGGASAAPPLPTGTPGNGGGLVRAPNGELVTPEVAKKRESWLRKWQRKKERKAGVSSPDAAPAPPPAPEPPGASAGVPDSGAPLAGSPGVVPWDENTVAPLVDCLVDEAEAITTDQILERAAKLGPEFEALAKKEARWNTLAKKTLKTTLPRIAAKYANKAGFDAQTADEVSAGAAVLVIYRGHKGLISKMDDMVKRMEALNSVSREAKP